MLMVTMLLILIFKILLLAFILVRSTCLLNKLIFACNCKPFRKLSSLKVILVKFYNITFLSGSVVVIVKYCLDYKVLIVFEIILKVSPFIET